MQGLVFATVIIAFTEVVCDVASVDSAALPLEHRSAYGLLQSESESSIEETWPLSGATDNPQIKHLQVQCEKTHMRVNIEFDRPFYGMIFSKGFYSDSNCVHLKPGSGHLSATFEIFLNSCGMSSSSNHNGNGYSSPTPSGSFVENTIIIQYDPYVQEVWDQARKLRCTWYDFYEKAVTFRPFQVDMLHAVTANFLGDNLQCWMQIQVGKGPWASEVSGIVKIGQTMTMVLAIKDDENKFDMLVRNCVAHDGKRAPIQLVDQHGCIVRPKIMSKFQKIKNFGPSASVVSFAYFQAFKFPDSMNVHFQCVIQVCRYNCPEPKCGNILLNNVEYGTSATMGNNIGADYDTPADATNNEYNILPAYPDPRHPVDTVGAFSDLQANVVLTPQAQVQSLNSDKNFTHLSSKIVDEFLIGSPLEGTNKRNDENRSKTSSEANLETLGGRPRSVANLEITNIDRMKRDIKAIDLTNSYKNNAQEMTDVNTSRTIQVVAPGDVNFSLSPNFNNETVIVQSARTTDSETVCVSVSSFVGGLVMLLLVLVVSSLIAAFLFVRVRHFERKGISASIVQSFVKTN